MPGDSTRNPFDSYVLTVFGVDVLSKPAGGGAPVLRGKLTEAELKKWRTAHPKARSERVGAWLPAAIYKQYTAQFFLSQGFYLAGRMNMGAQGEVDEVWLNDAGDGTEYRVNRSEWLAQPSPAPPPTDEAEADVKEAEQLPRDRKQERNRVIRAMRAVLDEPPGPERDAKLAAYEKIELDWLEHLTDDIERCHELSQKAHGERDKERIQNAATKLWALYTAFPYGDEWEGRTDLPLSVP